MKVLYPTQLSSSGNSTPVSGLTEGQSKVKALGLAVRFSVRSQEESEIQFQQKPPSRHKLLSYFREGCTGRVYSSHFLFLGEDEEETYKLFSFENPSLLNNPATRLDLSSFFFFFSEELSISVKDREQVTVSAVLCEYRSALPQPSNKHS